MNLNKLIKIINGKYINNIRSKKIINRFEYNTKNTKENDIFISINEGYKYINEDTLYLGIITDKKINIVDHPVILVDNVIEAMKKIAIYKRNKYNKTKYIGLTGSVGKTTTKELLYDILSKKYSVYKNQLNYNNHIGLPYTLMNINKNYDICLLEMGMNHKEEINYLSEICKPNIGIITKITNQHIENFNNNDEIINAKLEITNHLDGPLFIDKIYNKYTTYKQIINYENYTIEDININLKNTSFSILIDNKKYEIKYNIPAIHLIENIKKCIFISLYLGIGINDIINSINNFSMPNNRLNIYERNFTLIDDTYNSSLDSVIGLLDSIKYINKEKIIILGSILELGKHSIETHKKINEKLKEIKSTNILIGTETKVIDGIHFDNNKQIINYLKNIDLNDKLIIIKGSHALKLNEIVNHLLS